MNSSPFTSFKLDIGSDACNANWKPCGTVSHVRRILDELSESLGETYERILKEIRKPNQGHALRSLQCLVAAARPLEVKELAEVLAFDFITERIPKLNPDWRWEDREGAVMSACSSFGHDSQGRSFTRSRVVQFSHFSDKTANRLAEPIRNVSGYHVRLEAAHMILGDLLGLDNNVNCDNIEG